MRSEINCVFLYHCTKYVQRRQLSNRRGDRFQTGTEKWPENGAETGPQTGTDTGPQIGTETVLKPARGQASLVKMAGPTKEPFKISHVWSFCEILFHVGPRDFQQPF